MTIPFAAFRHKTFSHLHHQAADTQEAAQKQGAADHTAVIQEAGKGGIGKVPVGV